MKFCGRGELDVLYLIDAAGIQAALCTEDENSMDLSPGGLQAVDRVDTGLRNSLEICMVRFRVLPTYADLSLKIEERRWWFANCSMELDIIPGVCLSATRRCLGSSGVSRLPSASLPDICTYKRSPNALTTWAAL